MTRERERKEKREDDHCPASVPVATNLLECLSSAELEVCMCCTQAYIDSLATRVALRHPSNGGRGEMR